MNIPVDADRHQMNNRGGTRADITDDEQMAPYIRQVPFQVAYLVRKSEWHFFAE